MTRRGTWFLSTESRTADTAIPPYRIEERTRVLAVLSRWEAEWAPQTPVDAPARSGS